MGSIKHAKTSPVPNPLGDTRRVGGGDWNDEHIIDLEVSDIDGLEARLIPVDQVEQFRDDALQFRNEAAGSASDAAASAAEAAATLASTAKNADLADTIDAGKGAGRIGFNAALSYAVGTVGAFLKTLVVSTALAAFGGAGLVGFRQLYAAAVARTVEKKLQEVVSLFDFIPVAEQAAIIAGTSTYDATADIQAAINAANAVRAPGGRYLYAGAAINKNNFTLYGDGESDVIFEMLPVAATAFAVANVSNVSGLQIRNIRIEGNTTNLGGISLGTSALYAQRIDFKNLFITGFQNPAGGFGIKLGSNQNTDFEKVWVQECYYGLHRANGGYCTSTRISGKGSYFGRNCIHGIYIDGQCDDIFFQDAVIEGCKGVGLRVTANASTIAGAGRGSRINLNNVYFEENNKDGLSPFNSIHVVGNSVGYSQHTLKIAGTQFASNPSAPAGLKMIGVDRTYTYINNNRLLPSEFVPTSNCNTEWDGNKFPSAENYLTALKAMPGNVIARDFADNFGPTDLNQINLVNSLTFPAIARPVTDPNTLDDYEEGTWTPAATGFGGTIDSIVGRYTKIGQLVTLTVEIHGTNLSSTWNTSLIPVPFTVLQKSCAPVLNASAGTSLGLAYASSTGASHYLTTPTWAPIAGASAIFISAQYITAQ